MTGTDGGVSPEREITHALPLVRADGRLNRDAVGWKLVGRAAGNPARQSSFCHRLDLRR